jgi:hypothetical protein
MAYFHQLWWFEDKTLFDEQAIRLIGYDCEQTKSGEVFFNVFNHSLRLLFKACGS